MGIYLHRLIFFFLFDLLGFPIFNLDGIVFLNILKEHLIQCQFDKDKVVSHHSTVQRM